jgi:clan AA aspartic protease (TIGR02281 family)
VQGGTFLIPVLINGQITLNFTIDSGASVVTMPADVLITLARTGTVQKSDFIGKEKLHLANGSIVPSTTFLIRSLEVGNYLLENVKAAVVDTKGNLLLGQSFLSRFDSWSIDNKRQVLLLNPKTQQQQVQQSCTARIPTAAQHASGLVTGFLTDEQVLATTMAKRQF